MGHSSTELALFSLTHPQYPSVKYREELFPYSRHKDDVILASYRNQQFLKKLFDFWVAIGLLILLSPVLGIIAILVKLTSSGPVFFKSLRIGQYKNEFYMYKFRTMYLNSDKQRDMLRKEANQEKQLFKLENDPRITPLGKFLRQYSLDEFPQLLNVLKGDMSLVGPRPLAPDDSGLFEAPYTIRFQVIPGMTGLWQVSGRSLLNFDNLCQLDMNYILHWNLFLDGIILLRTISAVFLSRGAF